MINKSDWNDEYRDLLYDGRKRIEPPAVEDLEALYRGDLSDAEADRVREQLVYYAEMAAAMTDEQLGKDLAAIDAQESPVKPPETFPERRFPAQTLAIAASIIVVMVLGGIYLKIRDRPDLRNVLTRVLDADGHKGGAMTRGAGGGQTPIRLSTETDYLLKPVFRPQRTYREYRLELVDLGTSPPSSVWKRGGIQREPDGTFPAELPTANLEPGLYELVLYGIDAGQAERLATYTIRFSPP